MRAIALFAGLLLSLSMHEAAAQPRDKPAAKPNAPAAPQQNLPVSVEQAFYLIRSTLLTLNDANRSGNYTVLRDLAAPDFQARNSAADLSQSFADLRRRNFDLFAAALIAPQLTAAPRSTPTNCFAWREFFRRDRCQIHFDLLFQKVGEKWRLFGISIATPEAPAAKVTKPASN